MTKRYRLPRGRTVAEVDLLVPFHDVDALGVVWHGNYLRYFEVARTALERRLGVDLTVLRGQGVVCPVVESHCRHLAPLRFGDRACCQAWVAGLDRRLTIAYLLLNRTTKRLSAEGWTVQVAVDAASHLLLPELPDEITDRVRGAAGLDPRTAAGGGAWG